MRLKPINQQVAVVFGASSGIGRATALKLARQGARVVVASRSAAALEDLVLEIEEDGGVAMAIPAEATSFEEVQAVADGAVERFGRLDTWVHVAAVTMYAELEQTTPEEFRRVVDVNLNGQAYGAMAALPHLKENGGALIHISSVEAMRGMPYTSAYAASKHGVHGLVETLRLELRHAGYPISVTEIQPGTINTPLFNKARTKIGVKPIGPPPIYPPEAVADAILYAAQHPVRELVVGGAAKAMLVGQRLAPRLLDGLLLRMGFGSQRTDVPAPADAPDALDEPLPGYGHVEGDYSDKTLRRSAYTWMQTHPLTKGLLFAGALGAGAFALRRLTSR